MGGSAGFIGGRAGQRRHKRRANEETYPSLGDDVRAQAVDQGLRAVPESEEVNDLVAVFLLIVALVVMWVDDFFYDAERKKQ